MTAVTAVAKRLHRAAMYRVCGAALGYPEPGRLAHVAALAERVVDAADAALRPRVAALAAAARGTDAGAAAAEYVALFDGAARCVPCEGAYGPPRMAGKAAQLADIAGFYRAFGLEAASDHPEVEDHAATELEFMSVLALKEAWALAEGHFEHADITHDAAVAFLADHLGRWAPLFAEALTGATTLAYYRAVAALLGAWLAADTAALGVHTEPLAPPSADAGDAGAFSCPLAPSD